MQSCCTRAASAPSRPARENKAQAGRVSSWLAVSYTLGPRPTEKWGCLNLPIIRSSLPFSHNPAAPSGDRLRRAIGNIMSRAGAHDGRSNGNSVREKWARLRKNPEENTTKDPALVWPPPSQEPEISGENFIISFC